MMMLLYIMLSDNTILHTKKMIADNMMECKIRADNFSSATLRNNLVQPISWLKQAKQTGPVESASLADWSLLKSADRLYQIITYGPGTEVSSSGPEPSVLRPHVNFGTVDQLTKADQSDLPTSVR
jgi:hypothetical protein